MVDISESTLYPVLRRLQKSDYLTTYDVPFQGRNRRYYAITDKGKEILSFYCLASMGLGSLMILGTITLFKLVIKLIGKFFVKKKGAE